MLADDMGSTVGGPVVHLVLNLVFHQGAFFLDDEDFL